MEAGGETVASAYTAVCVTVAPAMVVKVCTPPGGLTQIFWPDKRLEQKAPMEGFQATSCWKVLPVVLAILSHVSPPWTLYVVHWGGMQILYDILSAPAKVILREFVNTDRSSQEITTVSVEVVDGNQCPCGTIFLFADGLAVVPTHHAILYS